MVELSAQEIKEIEFSLLKIFKDICIKHKIQYFLGYGTLLGAIRHKGFIPWDDDIDVWMTRENYNKFCSVISEEKEYNINFLSVQTEKNSYYAYGKLCDSTTRVIYPNAKEVERLGVYIDVFPLDNVPKTKLRTKLFFLKQEILFQKRMACITETYHKRKGFVRNFILRTIFCFSRMYNVFSIVKKIDKKAQKYNKKESSFCACNVMVPKLFEKKFFENSIPCEFEGEIFSMPVGAKEILTIQYGDYMKLPPEEQRVCKHGFKAYRV